MSRILLICDDYIGRKMAGPGQRYLELAKALSRKHRVSLLANSDADFDNEPFHVPTIPIFIEINLGLRIKIPNPALRRALAQYDFVIVKGEVLPAFSFPRIKGKFIIDLYCPAIFENLESSRHNQKKYDSELNSLRKIIKCGDLILCANERQRAFYLSLFPETGNDGPVIEIVPTGIPSTPPRHSKPVLKGIVPGIAQTDRVILWWGGIWNWLDPETAIRAVAQAAKAKNDLRLVFFGVKHPDLPLTEKARKAVLLAKELGVYEKNVFFLQQWIPYEERANWLLESDLGLICHYDTLETYYSWRTRVLDYFWASLPVITTEGDSMAELVKIHGLGKSVAPNDPDKLARAIQELLNDNGNYQKAKENIDKFKPAFYWENVIAPIERYLGQPK